MSTITSVADDTYTSIDPPVPSARIVPLARVWPAVQLMFDVPGIAWPEGHAVA